ncbi:MAG: hypothetical protein H7839_19290 [Magnetococcus sp. YQC-5]
MKHIGAKKRTVAMFLAERATVLTTSIQRRNDMTATSLPHKSAVKEGAILALDLGSKTGWALRQTDGSITSGTVEFKPGRFEGGGMAFLRFKKWLDEVRGFAEPLAFIAFEEVRSHIGVTAAHVYGGFLAHLTAWAEQHEIPYQGVPVGTIKKHATGKGNASKAEVIEAMRRKGYQPVDDNAADALAILHWALDEEVAK